MIMMRDIDMTLQDVFSFCFVYELEESTDILGYGISGRGLDMHAHILFTFTFIYIEP